MYSIIINCAAVAIVTYYKFVYTIATLPYCGMNVMGGLHVMYIHEYR